jgi:murein DD-endopeptidase MepM/ murein hydrolase activator NlpD
MKLLAIFMGLGILSVNFANGQFNTVYGNILPKQIKKIDADTTLLVIDTLMEADEAGMIEERVKVRTAEFRETTDNFLFSPLADVSYSSSFGTRVHPVTGQVKFHNGVDLRANYNNLYALAYGKVKKIGYNDIAGYYVIITHEEMETAYCHLSKIFVYEGDMIRGGQNIGVTGSSGRVTGPHLHLVIRYRGKLVNPARILPYCKPVKTFA